ncbi:MAG: nuclear transport factor 2 family protein [Gammaproteobacteria bacterium]
MLDSRFAREFAEHWIAAWNSHDLDAILSHYTDDFEMSSPVIVKLMREASGKLKGKNLVRAYWAKALELYPSLRFELEQVLVGANSVTIVYDGVRGLSAEVFHFDEQGKVYAAYAHYAAE